jgi:hypothetical protein
MTSGEVKRATSLAWRRASFCASHECVEVAQWADMIMVRDSGQSRGRALRCTAEDWKLFVRNIKAGRLVACAARL